MANFSASTYLKKCRLRTIEKPKVKVVNEKPDSAKTMTMTTIRTDTKVGSWTKNHKNLSFIVIKTASTLSPLIVSFAQQELQACNHLYVLSSHTVTT